MTHALTRVAAAGVAGALMLAQSGSAQAINRPTVDASVAPPPGSVGPVIPLEQRGACDVTGLIAGTDVVAPAPGARQLNLTGAWQFSRGAGQTVAVLDTGVQPGPRLPHVAPGGDYVANSDGLTDCDGHGTLVAGLIGGQPGADGFSGVAPEARLLSIRLTSDKFAPRAGGQDAAALRVQAGISALARAVVRAADLGARVIDVSSASCVAADAHTDQSALGAALRYAAVEKDAVIVAAAGNVGQSADAAAGTGAACQSNPADWSTVSSVSIPSSWQPYVLSVGSVDDDGQPSGFTLAGPWLGIAAPGENVLSLGNGTGGLANGVPNAKGELGHVSGTSFAAAYVAGVAALVRSRFPQLTAAEVEQRLTATAHRGARAPSNLVGAGTVDPVAALTWQLPGQRTEPSAHPIAAPAVVAPVNHTTRNAAWVGTLVLLALAALVIVAVNRREEPNK